MQTESARRDLVFDVLAEARLVISCQTRAIPTDAEWDAWLEAVRGLSQTIKEFRLLVVTEGGHPTRAQLDRLRHQNRTNPPTAIISPSSALRFFAAALTFINPSIRCYAPPDRDKAFDHIGLSRADRERAVTALERLQQRMAPTEQR